MGPALGEAFWIQTQMALIAAFILMAIIVFLIFRKSVPSMAVIISAVSDILITLAFMQIFDINISLAGLAALLMLIGYSVDTDIMLTSRLLKRHGEGSLSEGVRGALKTGLTMTITTIGALSVIVITNVTPVLTEIAGILLIGLSIDIVNTWLMNSVLLRWYLERKGG